MLPRVDSASQNQGSGKANSWLHLSAPSKPDDLLSTGLQVHSYPSTRLSDVRSPKSPTIPANWPRGGPQLLPQTRGTGTDARPTPSHGVSKPEQALIDLGGDSSSDLAATLESSLYPAETASQKPLARSDSNDSISKILYDSTPVPPPASSPTGPERCDSGNPFALPNLSVPAPLPAASQAALLHGQASLPQHSSLARLPSTGASGLLCTTYSTELPPPSSTGASTLHNGWSAPLPPGWLPFPGPEAPVHSRSLSDGHGILGRTWSATAANIDPCAEVLVNTFADFSKDMVSAHASRAPMKRQVSMNSQRSMQSMQ